MKATDTYDILVVIVPCCKHLICPFVTTKVVDSHVFGSHLLFPFVRYHVIGGFIILQKRGLGFESCTNVEVNYGYSKTSCIANDYVLLQYQNNFTVKGEFKSN